MLHPDFPIVNGHYQMTDDWFITLEQSYNKRVEDGSLVLWRPGFTIWVDIWDNDNNETINERALLRQKDISKDAYELKKYISNGITKIGYRLDEKRTEEIVFAYYGFAINKDSHVQIAFYFDDSKDLNSAKNIFSNLKETTP